MKIILIGMPGAGKTTVAQAFAESSGYVFVDTDAIIEVQQQQTTGNLLLTKGELFFRQAEFQALQSIPESDNLIVASGGGIVVYPDSYRYIKKHFDLVVYLQTPIAVLSTRLASDEKLRPLLDTYRLEQLMAEREGLYKELAHCVVDSANKSAAVIVIELLNLIK